MAPGLAFNQLPNGFVEVSGYCVVSNRFYAVVVKEEQLERYIEGELVQRAFPDLSAEDREFLVSRTSPLGWARLFKGSNYD